MTLRGTFGKLREAWIWPRQADFRSYARHRKVLRNASANSMSIGTRHATQLAFLPEVTSMQNPLAEIPNLVERSTPALHDTFAPFKTLIKRSDGIGLSVPAITL